MEKLSELEMTELLRSALEESEEFGQELQSASTFREAGLLTNNEGLELRLSNGQIFQLTLRTYQRRGL